MRFTLLTPTYNRAPYVERVYKGLCAQTFHDFEWVIIDDGSADNTRELVATWKPFFPIRYYWKPNGGKHTAVNMGVTKAEGEFIVMMDSDEQPVPYMLERFDYHWKQIPNPERFSTLVALLFSEDGVTVLGDRFPQEVFDVFDIGEALKLAKCDLGGIVRTDLFKKFLYPEFKNERYMAEGVVWNRLMRRYGSRYVNEPLKLAGYAPGGLGRSGDLRYSNPKGAVVYNAELAFSRKIPLRVRTKAAVTAVYFSMVAVGREIKLFFSRGGKKINN